MSLCCAATCAQGGSWSASAEVGDIRCSGAETHGIFDDRNVPLNVLCTFDSILHVVDDVAYWGLLEDLARKGTSG